MTDGGSCLAEVLVSPAAAARLAHLGPWVETRRRQRPTRPLLILADRLATAVEAVHPLLLDDAGDRALFGVYRSTPELLARELAGPTLVDRQLAFAGGAAHQAVVVRALHEVAGELSHFAPVARAPGFARVLARALDELAHHRVGPEELRAEGGVTARELALLVVSYRRLLADEGLVDRAGLLDAAIERLERHDLDEHPLRGGAALLLDLELRTPLEADFLRALGRLDLELSALVPHGDGDTLAVLQQLTGAPLEARRVEPPEAAESALSRLQRQLFADVVETADEEAEGAEEATPSLEIFSGPTPQAECVEIVRRALTLVDGGLRADEIGVFVRQATPYVELLQEAFARAGLKVFAAEGAYLPDPSGRAFLALLRCALEGLPASRFAEYLSLGQVPGAEVHEARDDDAVYELLEPEDAGGYEVDDEVLAERKALGAQPPLPGRWEQLIGDAAVVAGGLERWRRRLAALDEELGLLSKAAAREEDTPERAPGAEGAGGEPQGSQPDKEDPKLAAIRRDRDQLARLGAFALPILERLDGLRSAGGPEGAPSWSGWIELLEPLAAEALAHPQRVLELLEHLRPLAGTGAVPLSQVVETLDDRLRDLRQRPPRQRAGRIYIGLAEEVRGRSFSAVFVAGLAERSFPAKVLQNPVLLDELRGSLASHAARLPALPRAAQRRARERLFLHLAVGAASRFVGLSYPRMELSPPQPRVPSFYLLEASRAVEGRLPDFEQLISDAAERGALRLERPFPRVPEVAVDVQEYDLALLGEATQRRRSAPHEDLAGLAGHLHEHAFLVPALRAHWRRGGKGLSAADGLVVAQESGRGLLAEDTLRARPYGVTALERYARCPYQLYLHSVLRLRPALSLEVEGDGVLDPKTWGSFFHRVQFEVGRALADEGLVPLEPGPRLEAARRILAEKVAAVAAELEELLAPAVRVLWDQEVAHLEAQLASWLRREARAGAGLRAEHFELAFGLPARPRPGGDTHRDEASQSAPVVLDRGYQLRGSMDLVERAPDKTLRITDHKTGAAPPKSQVTPFEGGQGLQRVLYGLCLETLMPGAQVAAGRLYYCTERGGYRELEQPLTQVVRSQAMDILRAIDEALEGGLLPAVPIEEDTCKRCDYQRICGGAAAERAKDKIADPRLSKLRLLREL